MNELAFIAFELAIVAIATLCVGTFTPPLDRWLPWGRAFRRWTKRRVMEKMHELERRATPPMPESPATAPLGYRDNATMIRVESAPIADASLIARYRARRDAKLMLQLEMDAEEQSAEAPERHARV